MTTDPCCILCILLGIVGVILLCGQLRATPNLQRRLDELRKERQSI